MNEKQLYASLKRIFNKNELQFLVENTMFEKGGIITMEEIRSSFSSWLDKKVSKLDKGTFVQVNEKYTIEKINICKSCRGKYRSGCCERYAKNNKSTTYAVNNIAWRDI